MSNRILVTQTGGWVGTMVLPTPALRALKIAHPQSHLSLLISPLVADLMATNPYTDEIMVDNKRRGLKSTIFLEAGERYSPVRL